MQQILPHASRGARRLALGLQALVLVGAGLTPLVLSATASAAGQLGFRSVAISTATASATGNYVLSFNVATAGQIQGLKFQACTTALGTCTGPAGQNLSAATYGSQSGWQGATAFAKDAAGANDCVPPGSAPFNIICLNRTDATSETTAGSHVVTINGVVNPSAVNTTFFVRMTTYNTNTYTVGSIVDQGTVAGSTAQVLTVNAAVAESLTFCVGSTIIDDSTTAPGTCASISGTSLNLGTLDSTSISVSPVTSNGGDSKNGIAELSTNAVNGATVQYKAVQQAGTNHQGTLRVSGNACSAGNTNTDPCIDAQGATQGTFTAGTEKYGMTVAGTNCVSTTAYTCSLGAGTNNLKASSNYIGATATTYGSTAGFAWVEAGTATQIAASTTVVDKESLILKFASTPSIATPTGSYTAQADYIATVTY